MKRIGIYILILILTVALSACSAEKKQLPEQPQNPNKLQVVVSFNAMGELARAVGGDKIELRTIIPDGAEPHDFDPKASDLASLAQARVFIINGFGLENDWAPKAIEAAGNKDLLVVTASTGAEAVTDPRPTLFGKNDGQADTDPHLWLSLQGAKLESRNICQAFSQADPANKAYYEKRYAAFATQLDQLYAQYEDKFTNEQKKVFVTGHSAFSYPARDFGLTQKSLQNVFASGEPSARRLKELADFCKANHITTIFVENMESPKISQTLADETNAEVEALDTMESSDGDKTYLDIQSENLEKIYRSMR
jgi:zinc transport system substrate-binding protein